MDSWVEEQDTKNYQRCILTQNLKALELWITSLIKSSPHPNLTNVELQLHT